MDEQAVRDHAQGHLDALLAGDVDRAIQDLSQELQRNLGEIMAMLPLPLTAADIESINVGASSYTAVLHLVGETTESRLETRWKDRDGRPTMVEASLIHEAPTATGDTADGEGPADDAS
jgi:hypothetical protein